MRRALFISDFVPLRSTGGGMEKEQKGQGLVEYALIIILVAIVVIVLVAIFGQAVGNMFSTIVSNI